MSYLACLNLDIRAAKELGMVDSYHWHKRTWDLFDSDSDSKRDFLHRLESTERNFKLWILGKRLPKCPDWCDSQSFFVKEIPNSFLTHKRYSFDLVANPTKAVLNKEGANNDKKRGKRVPLVKEDDLRNWLIRKGEARSLDSNHNPVSGGFRIIDSVPLEIRPMVESHFKKGSHSAYHGGVRFRGCLEVTDKERFAESYFSGIGGAKGFGFGLMLLAPIKLIN